MLCCPFDYGLRLLPDLDGEILGMNSERIISDWLENVFAVHAHIAAVNIAAG